MSGVYREYRPSAALAPYVECYWSRAVAGGDALAAPHTVLPDGCMDLVFDFAPQPQVSGIGSGARSRPTWGGAVVGTMTVPLHVAPRPAQDFFGVRFRPAMAPAFLRASAAEFTDASVPLAAVWGREGLELEQRLAAARAIPRRVAVMERELLRRLPRLPAADLRVHAAVQLILARSGAVSIAAAASYAGITRQHLARRFAEHVGVSPKLFSRVVRFQSLLAHLHDRRALLWSDAAAAAGYYDQSHLIADFRQFAGLTPQRFFATRAA